MDPVEPRKIVVLDTNMVIYEADYPQTGSLEGKLASQALLAISELGYQPAITPGTVRDIERGGRYKESRLRAIEKYNILTPAASHDLQERAGYKKDLTPNDSCDLEILAAIDQGLANWLITNDLGMIKHAKKARLEHVSLAEDFISFAGAAQVSAPLPDSISEVSPSMVDIGLNFFDSLKASYPEFEKWWKEKVVVGNRDTFIIKFEDELRALCVLKPNDNSYGLPPDATKICTFKISEDKRGLKFGELLLATVIKKIRSLHSSTVFIEVADDNELIDWLKGFGFTRLENERAANGDVVLVKRIFPSNSKKHQDPWEYHLAYGPGALLCRKAFVVPIETKWHRRLFPASHEPTLFPSQEEPCGNAITKIYMSNTPSRKPSKGDVLVFVESGTGKRVSNIGIVEDVLVASDAMKIVSFAKNRTVYTPKEVGEKCAHGEVHVMKFRHDRMLMPSWSRKDKGYAKHVGRINARPVTEIRGEDLEWLRQELEEWH